MISFFRKIRQSLLKEGKTARYFKYAIGEILLVVIGILIALQINNWNEQRKENHKEQIYLSNLKRDLQHQSSLIDIQIEEEKKYSANTQPIIDYFNKHQKIEMNSVFMQNLSIATERKTFVRTDPTYTDLISSGNIDVIKDLDFKNKLILYYQNVERIELITQNNNIHLNDKIYFSNIIKFIYFNDDSKSQSPAMLEITNKILEKPENQLWLINLVNFRKHLAEHSIESMLEIKAQTQELLDLMDKRR